MSKLPKGLISFGPDANCTLVLCKPEWSVVGYQPSIPANAAFLALFGLSLLAHLCQGVYFWRKGRPAWGYMTLIVLGCADEIVGYVGRLMLHDNPFGFISFLVQIICVTTAPVFFCAAIYITLSQTINFIDPSKSRFDPRLFYWVFIPCDIISLVLQAVGGALSSVARTESAVNRGVKISLAGLVFQVVTLVAFTLLFIDYLRSCGFLASFFSSSASSGSSGRTTATGMRENEKTTTTTAGSKQPVRHFARSLKVFMVFLFLATLFVFVRCAYRIKELSEGYFSQFFREENLFIALESCMMVLAVFCLNVSHPGYGFQTAPVSSSHSPSSSTSTNDDGSATTAAAGSGSKPHTGGVVDSSSDADGSRV
ncbi:RTA1 like protein-domain-containing protein [Microdochium bolleyi]|uniref:RTA1 like protein-domain-containing protein n=1 Tax=Microdochium bolleyi TaxID=196109 RepID=A0A136IY63_9PEZI|nr:RTA1 like protein-domain-containing protein [Microdochium bolleyi]